METPPPPLSTELRKTAAMAHLSMFFLFKNRSIGLIVYRLKMIEMGVVLPQSGR